MAALIPSNNNETSCLRSDKGPSRRSQSRLRKYQRKYLGRLMALCPHENVHPDFLPVINQYRLGWSSRRSGPEMLTGNTSEYSWRDFISY